MTTRGKPFQKGASGNPGGRPRAIAEVTALAREHTEEALETLVQIALHGKSEAARVSAANAILDRAYGRPPQFTTGSAAEFRLATEMSDDELAAIAAGEDPDGLPPAGGVH